MQILRPVITVILTAICGALITLFIHSHNANKENKLDADSFVLTIPRYLIIIFLIMSVLLAVIITLIIFLASVKDIAIAVPIVGIIFTLFVFATFGGIKEKVYVNGTEIIYIPALGKKRALEFSSIKKVISKSNSYGMIFYRVYVDKKVFSFSSLFIGCRLLVSAFEKNGIKITYK